MKLYVNGVFVHKAKGIKSNSVGWNFTQLVLGRDEDLSPSISENYVIHIDDFTIWFKALSEVEIAYIMTQSKQAENYIDVLYMLLSLCFCLSSVVLAFIILYAVVISIIK